MILSIANASRKIYIYLIRPIFLSAYLYTSLIELGYNRKKTIYFKGVSSMKDFFQKMLMSVQKFMVGRYGVDQLSLFLLGSTLVTSLLGGFFTSWLFSALSFLLLVVCYYRILSKKLYKRQQENYKFLHIWYPIRDWCQKKISRLKGMKTHKYFKCQQCKQTLRVPRGKGKLTITCPKCKHEMHKKS